MKRITAVARGRVQAVGYRYFVTASAREAGVSGFVKNMPDGSVLIVAKGGREALDVFLNWSWLLANRLSGSMIFLLVRVKHAASSPGSG